jgi:hypothetical protein
MNELRDKYASVHGEPTRAGNRTWLVKKIAWRLQALAEGDLSDRARQRAAELANDADFRILEPRTAPAAPTPIGVPAPPEAPAPQPPRSSARLMPGIVLNRIYKGEALQVRVLADGFEFEGNRYASLSAVAKAITGSHWNGRLFFGIGGQGGGR